MMTRSCPGRPRPGLVWGVLFFLVAGCTLERRDDLPEQVIQLLEAQNGDEGAMVYQTVAVFREAIEDGDISLALRLLDREARLIDDLVDRDTDPLPSLQETRGFQLLALRRAHEAGLTLELQDTELAWVDEMALLTSLLRASVEAPEEGDRAEAADLITPGWVRESVLLRRTGEGWRILLLHRSRLPDATP